MKKFVIGFGAGILFYEALMQLVWVGGQWGDFSRRVDEKMGSRQWRVNLRNKIEEFQEKYGDGSVDPYNALSLEELVRQVQADEARGVWRSGG